MPFSKYSPKQKKLARVAKAPKGYHFMKSGKTYKLMKHTGSFKAHKGASLTAEFEVQKVHND